MKHTVRSTQPEVCGTIRCRSPAEIPLQACQCLQEQVPEEAQLEQHLHLSVAIHQYRATR